MQKIDHYESMRLLKPKLASTKQRLLARIIDLVLEFAPLGALGLIVKKYVDIEAQLIIDAEVARRAAFLTSFFALTLIVHIVQWMLLISRGQTIGKMICHIRVVNAGSDTHASIVQLIVLRTWLNALLMGNAIYFFVDSLLIFREPRRCLHDYLAGTEVVEE
ncbi:hypothetical protein COU76_04180 [Candidatus Peregrinibacteria bacterium CG10_big_fil_rev_8_21_14_0_10_49_10]|nr:MAG: hypothetical protein COU76_04180 [Candidatus Peregrinibacteria bacterium CG10_big_fil_rev_8_21_14_0_10_49_10]